MRKFLRSYSIELFLMGILLIAVGYFAYLGYGLLMVDLGDEVSGDEALAYVSQQLEYGPRTTGSDASNAMSDWLTNELTGREWDVLIQPYSVLTPSIIAGQAITTSITASTTASSTAPLMGQNVIAIRQPSGVTGQSTAPVAILAAPYDSRVFADADPDPARRTEASPGANVGASGAAILLEMARTLADTGHTVCLVFLDSEANRDLPGWQPPFGGHRFVEQLGNQIDQCADPRFAVVVDAVGGTDHQLRIEGRSDPQISAAIWQTAADLGFGEQFLNEIGPAQSGPHNTLIEAGIPTVLITDHTYPHRNTTGDTLDKISAQSLERVGLTLQMWLEQGAPFAGN